MLFTIINLTIKRIQACAIEKIPGKIMVKPRQELILVVRTTSVTASRGKLCSVGNDRDFVPQITRRRFGVSSLFPLIIIF